MCLRKKGMCEKEDVYMCLRKGERGIYVFEKEGVCV